MSLDTKLPEVTDDVFDEYADKLTSLAREAGIRIVRSSIRACFSADVRLVTAAASDLEQGGGNMLGVFHISGRVGGDVVKPGFYAACVEWEGNRALACLRNERGDEVARLPLKITCGDDMPVQAMLGCCSQPEIGEGSVCTGFTCCSPIGGCIGHQFCFAI